MATIDLKTTDRSWYAPGTDPSTVELPPLPYLMVDGAGAPDPTTSAEYGAAIASLYPVAYGIRSAIKADTGDAYVVMPLEGLWWADDMEAFVTGDRDAWEWTLMIRLPPAADVSVVDQIIADTARRKDLPAEPRHELLDEGTVAQVMHLGPYSAEAPVIAGLHDYIGASGNVPTGRHHEIYLSDPQRIAPDRLRTVIRQPMRPKP